MSNDRQSRRHRNLAVIIGIDRYQDDRIRNLSTAVNDAKAIATLLREDYQYAQVWELFDEQASHEGVQTLLKTTLPQAVQKGDRVLFYFAGHGITRKGKDGSPAGYLILQDARIDLEKAEPDPAAEQANQAGQAEKFLPMQDLYDAFNAIDCHHLLVILDCCYAGMFRWATRKMIVIPERIHREHYNRFIRFPAWQVLASAAHDQEALDLVTDQRGLIPGTHHSPFALALLQGLGHMEETLNADLTGDGVITTPELHLYVDRAVNQWTHERQTPGFWSLRPEYDRGEFIFTRPGFDPNKRLTPAPPLNASNNPYRGLESFEERHAHFFFGRKSLIADLYEQHLCQPDRSLTIVLGVSGSGKSSLVKAGLIPYLRQKQEGSQSHSQSQSQPQSQSYSQPQSQSHSQSQSQFQVQQWRILEPMRPGESPFMALARILLPIAHPNLVKQLEPLQGLQALFQETKLLSRGDRSQRSPSGLESESESESESDPDAAFTQLATAWKIATPETRLLLVVDYFEELQKRCADEALVELRATIQQQMEQLADRLQCDDQMLSQVITTWSQTQPNTKLLLIIDQFEELVTLAQDYQEHPQSESKKQPFLTGLSLALTHHRHRLHMVLTLRSDFEPRFLESPLKADWGNSRFWVQAMTTDELRQAIEGPALKQALYFEPPDLVGRLVDEVGQTAGALPLLSFTLSELYIMLVQRWRDTHSTERALKLEDYIQLEGVAGSLTRRATEEYQQIGQDAALGEAGQRTMQRVMLRLVTIEGGEAARRRVPESELRYATAAENQRLGLVVDRLVKARLLVKGQEKGTAYIEPAHDYLIRGWPRLRDWIAAEREHLALQRRLTPEAKKWVETGVETGSETGTAPQENRSPATGMRQNWTRRFAASKQLWNADPYLEVLAQKLQTEPDWFNQIEAQFVRSSLHKKRRNTIVRWSIAGSVLLGSVVFSAAVWMQWRNSELNQADSLGRYSQILLSGGKELDAMVQAIKAGKTLQSQHAYNPAVMRALQAAIYDGRNEHNRLEDHVDAVNSVSISPDGQLLASGSDDNTVKLWDLATGRLIRTFTGHYNRVTSVSFTPDGQTLASGSWDNTVRLWNLQTGEAIRTLVVRQDVPGTNVVISQDGGKTLDDFVKSISISPDGQTLISGSGDGTIALWNLDTGQAIRTLKEHADGVSSVSISPDGQTLASGSDDNTIKLWNLETGQVIRTLKGHEGSVTRVSFSADGQTLASNGSDDTLKLWNLATGQVIRTLRGRYAGVSFSPDGQTLAAGGDGSIEFWDLATGQSIRTLKGHDSWVMSISFSPDGQTLASGSQDNSIRLWDLATKPDIRTLKGHKSEVIKVSISPDGQTLVSSDGHESMLWDLATGQPSRTLNGYSGQDSFSPAGKPLLATSSGNSIQLWDLATGQSVKTLTAQAEGIIVQGFSPDGKTLAASNAATIQLWDLETGQPIRLFEGGDPLIAIVSSVSFSPDGTMLASSSWDKTIQLWNLETGEAIRTLKGHSSGVIHVRFSPDGKMLASASADNSVKLWNLETGQEIRTLKHDFTVNSVRFSPDGKVLASASDDRTIKLWDLETGQEIRTLRGHTNSVTSISFSPDGKLLASASWDKTVKLWNLDFGLASLIGRGCDWVHPYLQTNPLLSDGDRHVCDKVSGLSF